MNKEHIVGVLAGHQKVSMGMTSGSPDTCKCGERTYPAAGVDITDRRDVAFAAHQAEVLAPLIAQAQAHALKAAANDLAGLQYVRPDAEGRAEYERVLAVRRGNTDAWLRARAAAITGDQG